MEKFNKTFLCKYHSAIAVVMNPKTYRLQDNVQHFPLSDSETPHFKRENKNNNIPTSDTGSSTLCKVF